MENRIKQLKPTMTLEFKLGSMTQSIHQLFEQQVQRTPEAMALIGENRQISYESLNQKANQLAHYLQKCGLKSDCSGKKNTHSRTVIQLWWKYKKDLFEADTIARIASNFENLLEVIVNQ